MSITIHERLAIEKALEKHEGCRPNRGHPNWKLYHDPEIGWYWDSDENDPAELDPIFDAEARLILTGAMVEWWATHASPFGVSIYPPRKTDMWACSDAWDEDRTSEAPSFLFLIARAIAAMPRIEVSEPNSVPSVVNSSKGGEQRAH